MIKSFVDKETEKVYNQIFSKKLPQTIQRIALRKLMMIDNARCLEDLRVPPANHLELLHGDREGQYITSIFNTAFASTLMEMISLTLRLWTIIRKSVYTEIKSERKVYLWNILQLLQ
ncbi:MAG: type II toxin-antitoxin system RelE/ParE family toxin [Lachnospiraceae bacterium]